MTEQRKSERLVIHRMVECPFRCGKLVKVEVCLTCVYQIKLDSKKKHVDCGFSAAWERKYGHIEIEEV